MFYSYTNYGNDRSMQSLIFRDLKTSHSIVDEVYSYEKKKNFRPGKIHLYMLLSFPKILPRKKNRFQTTKNSPLHDSIISKKFIRIEHGIRIATPLTAFL